MPSPVGDTSLPPQPPCQPLASRVVRPHGVTGQAIGDGQGSGEGPSHAVASLSDKLQHVISPLFYNQPTEHAHVMRTAA
jgi:hypothetical protein